MDLDPSYAARMNAAAGIEVERVVRSSEHGAMGVTTDDHLIVVGPYPRYDPSLDFSPSLEVLGRTRWISDAHYLKRLPDISNEESAELPKVITKQVSLMSVDDKDSVARVRVSKNQPFVRSDAIK